MSQFLNPANWNVSSTSFILHIDSYNKFSLVTSLDSTVVRNTITALFVVANLCAATAGARYIKTRARSRIAKGQAISVKHLTSWLSLKEAAKYSWSLRGIPGGWLGLLMVFTGLIGILHQFATNSLVTPTSVPTRCIFDYGAVWEAEGFSYAPGPDDYGSDLVFEAQLAAENNHGVRGIYHRFFAPNEIQMFRPEAEDTFGSWNCRNIMNQSLPWIGPALPANQATLKTAVGVTQKSYAAYLGNYADRHGFGYYEESQLQRTESEWTVYSAMFWQVPKNTSWRSVQASILNRVPLVDGKANVMEFDCQIALTGKLPIKAFYLDIKEVLETWAPKAFGYQKQLSTVEESQVWLEIVLNQIFMLAIFNDWVIPQNVNSTESIGCVVVGTRVSVGIIMILGAVALLFLGLVIAQCYHLLKDRQRQSKKNDSLLPFDLADWQLAAYRQGNTGGTPKFKLLRNAVCRQDGDGITVDMPSLAERVHESESRTTTTDEKFEWKDRDGIGYHTQHSSRKPWIHILERPRFKSDGQSSIISPHSSVGDIGNVQRTD